MEKQIKILKAVEDTLEKVSVAGSENMDRQLGCIRAIQGVRLDLIKMEKEAKADAESSAAAKQQRDPEDAAGTV